jgi:hypothetical protein
MTDHSIIRPAIADLPFEAEARFLTNLLKAVFVDLPATFRRALAAQRIYNDLYLLDGPGLAALGLEHGTVGRFALEQARVIAPAGR